MTAEREFFLHLGVHKTGTTALQRFLDTNQVQLSTAGVHWLKTGRSNGIPGAWGHHGLAWALRDGDADGLWQRIADEAADHPKSLASSEEFCLLQRKGFYENIASAMAGSHIRPIVFLRPQDQLLESIYNHHVKALGETRPIVDFAKVVMHRLDFASLISRLSEVFGAETLVVRIYDKSQMTGDIFYEFLSTIGVLDQTHFRKLTAVDNPGLSYEGVQAMLQANRDFANDAAQLKSKRLSILGDYQAKPWTRHSILREDERAELMKRFHDGNSEIAARFFNRSVLFS